MHEGSVLKATMTVVMGGGRFTYIASSRICAMFDVLAIDIVWVALPVGAAVQHP